MAKIHDHTAKTIISIYVKNHQKDAMNSFKSKVFLLIILMTAVIFAQPSQMHIDGEPSKSPSEIVAVRDASGNFCAAIKVISDLDGFRYAAYNGVVRVDDNPGMDMVYLSTSERVLEVFHTGYEPLKIILSEHIISLKEKDVWEIRITGEKKPINVMILTEPSDAEKILDGVSLGTGEVFQIIPGKHELRLKKEGYKGKTITIEVAEGKTLFKNITLTEIDIVAVQIRSNPQGTMVFIGGMEKGKTDLPIWLYPETYDLKLTMSGYLDVNQSITVTEGQTNDFHYTLTKNVGTLSISITPHDAKVLINKHDYGTKRIIELAPGKYKVEIVKDGWYSESEMLSIELGQILHRNYTLKQKTGKLQFSVNPLDAQVSMKTKDGITYKTWTGMQFLKEVPVGSYELVCKAAKYKTQQKIVTTSENKTLQLHIQLEEGSDFISGIEMIFVKGGTFTMGDVWGGGNSGEKPTHRVTVSDFYIGKYEMTQKQYREIMGSNPSHFSGDNNPVEKGSWYDAVKFCNKLSQKEGLTPCYTINGTNVTCNFSAKGYRLPTEAEWEYAARSGGRNDRKWSGTNSESSIKNYAWESLYGSHPVGTKQPNDLGIYDMSGNVWEWCWDWYGSYSSSNQTNPTGPASGSYRVLRGGSWYGYSSYRTAYRYRYYPTPSYSKVGFRILRTK